MENQLVYCNTFPARRRETTIIYPSISEYGKFEQAIEFYKKALLLDPSLIKIQSLIVNTNQKKTEIDALVAEYAEANQLTYNSKALF